MRNKIVTAAEAVAVIQNGDAFCTSGFVGIGVPDALLVALHRGFDGFDQRKTGRHSGATRTSMLRATPGWRRISPTRSSVSTIWCTEGGLTPKWRWMSASAGGRPSTRV